MTVYYQLAFLLLVSEMATFCLLVAPLPYVVRKRLFTFLSESPLVAKVAYGIKIAFISILVLFVDAVQRMIRITAETEAAKANSGAAVHNMQTEVNFAARKFYAQRNTYLTGFTLFLSLVLTRTFYIVLDLIHAQEEYAKLKASVAPADASAGAKGKGKGAPADPAVQIAELKKQLAASEAKERDFETLKKQAAQQAAEFDRLATKYNEATGANSSKRAD